MQQLTSGGGGRPLDSGLNRDKKWQIGLVLNWFFMQVRSCKKFFADKFEISAAFYDPALSLKQAEKSIGWTKKYIELFFKCSFYRLEVNVT